MDHLPIALARRLTNSTSGLDRFTKAGCGTHFVNDVIRSFDLHLDPTKKQVRSNTGFAHFETSNPENIPLETLNSEFPFVFSRTVSSPST